MWAVPTLRIREKFSKIEASGLSTGALTLPPKTIISRYYAEDRVVPVNISNLSIDITINNFHTFDYTAKRPHMQLVELPVCSINLKPHGIMPSWNSKYPI
jgi:hypothetical protein